MPWNRILFESGGLGVALAAWEEAAFGVAAGTEDGREGAGLA
jgi:hypothetical protein